MSEEILFKLTDEEYELMHELGLYYLSDKRKLLKLYLENQVLRTRLQVYRELGLILEIPDPKAPIPFELTPKALAELRDSAESEAAVAKPLVARSFEEAIGLPPAPAPSAPAPSKEDL